MAAQFVSKPAKVRIEFENGKSQTYDCFNPECTDENLFLGAQTLGYFNADNTDGKAYVKLETKSFILA